KTGAVPGARHQPNGGGRRRFRKGRSRWGVCLIGGHRGRVARLARAPKRATVIEPRGECCAIAIMAKAPRIGAAKTRLVPPLSAADADGLIFCFIHGAPATIAEKAL